ncbi:hypothetical protein AYO44_11870 [Planctomycetaceae bacterium SCGC AG-212-F19]|nr:hypothetical protein AYO44_11870 [Planctomycetaceae bacterium SCGC AG-212-F19]
MHGHPLPFLIPEPSASCLDMIPPRYVAICNPDGKRWQAYARELSDYCQQRGLVPEVEVVPWNLVVPRDGCLNGLAAFDRPAIVRLESPGRDFDVIKLLLAAGARDAGDASTDWLALTYQKGKLIRPGLLHRGFCRVLRGLRQAFNARPHLTPLACPLAIAELFDKNATAARLTAAGLPCPPSLTPPSSPAALLTDLCTRRCPTAYVKLATGSSATGIAVVHALDDLPWAITTMVPIDGHFFNSRRLRRVSGAELTDVLAFILAEGACVQCGIPMAQLDGQNFDVRVIVIHGAPAFTIFRLSSAPMTNLHLGGRRGDTALCRAAIPTRAWLDAIGHCVEAAALYPCAVVGVDLLFERGYLHHYILEVNAFGDWFPDFTDEQGRTVHRVEIEMTAGRLGLVE